MERFAHLAAQALNESVENLPAKLTGNDLEIPPDPAMGDFAFPCFRLAKSYRKKPNEIAAEIALDLSAKLNSDRIKAIAQGPYVNFLVNKQTVMNEILCDIIQGDHLGSYGMLPEKSRDIWALEYSSPNVAKPFQIYHLRPTALGAALDRIGRFRGHNMVSINHLGDWGTQYGKIAVALRLWGEDLPAEPSIMDLVQIYVRFHSEAEKNPDLEDQAREAFAKLENGDPEITAIWKRCVEISMREFSRIYARINVNFDHFWGESHYKDFLQPLIDDLKAKKLLVESDGAMVVPVNDAKGNELPPCIIQKKDGATLYATRDLAAAIYRKDKLKFDRMTYIVGGEQRLHFQQVFTVLEKMGFDWVKTCHHVPTGLYRFKDSKMSTRKGNFITMEDTLALAKERVTTLMEERAAHPEHPGIEPNDEIAEKIAVGAVLFHDLHNDAARDVEFDLERVVDFEGETGPYMQYAHTRCLSIFRKARATANGNIADGQAFPKMSELLIHDKEQLLVKNLGRFPLYLEKTLDQCKASQLAQYLIDVTKAFNVFYRECRVLDWEKNPELTRARLCLVEATRRVLHRGLNLLGLPLPDQM